MHYLRYILLSFLVSVSSSAFAWDSFGHMVIAELALAELSPAKQRKIEQQAFSLVRQQDTETRLYLMRNFPDTSSFAQLSVFADTYRNETISALYERYANQIPSQLKKFRDEDNSTWHYKNQFYRDLPIAHPDAPEPQVCEDTEEANVVWAIENLQQAVKEATTPEDQAVSLALLIHFVGDAHQPLHGISKVDENCQSDRGGNGFCVTYRGVGRSCETTLHAYWDRSLDFYDEYNKVAEAVEQIARVEVKETDSQILDPVEWLAESFRYARFVYSLKEGTEGDPYYIEEGQIISYERQALAAKRLALILDDLY